MLHIFDLWILSFILEIQLEIKCLKLVVQLFLNIQEYHAILMTYMLWISFYSIVLIDFLDLQLTFKYQLWMIE